MRVDHEDLKSKEGLTNMTSKVDWDKPIEVVYVDSYDNKTYIFEAENIKEINGDEHILSVIEDGKENIVAFDVNGNYIDLNQNYEECTVRNVVENPREFELWVNVYDGIVKPMGHTSRKQADLHHNLFFNAHNRIACKRVVIKEGEYDE